MNITVIGTGYVGLVNGACLSQLGNNVTCVDNNTDKIDKLNNGIVTIYEPGLDDIIRWNKAKGKLHFSDNYNSIKNSDVVFICVGTPTKKTGKGVDLQYIEIAIGEICKHIEKDILIVIKSTVPAGTSRKMKKMVSENLKNRYMFEPVWFDVISNPEFLKEGSAVDDFFNPDRVIVGAEDKRSIAIMKKLYGEDIYVVKTESSEMIKYASNAMLATRISFMNELANMCECYDADFNEVKLGVGLDKRIGTRFLNAGCGYGGSCFPKDVDGFLMMGEEAGVDLNVVRATEIANNKQKHIILEKLKRIGDIDDKTVSILGLSFKPNTDDIREAPSLTIIKDIQNNFNNVNIKVYDPISMDACKEQLNDDSIYYSNDVWDCLKDSNIVILVTEWDVFQKIDWKKASELMKDSPIVIDGRNVLNARDIVNNGFCYIKIG